MYQRDRLGQDWFSDVTPDFGPSPIVETTLPVDYGSASSWSFYEQPYSPTYEAPVSYEAPSTYQLPEIIAPSQPAPQPIDWSKVTPESSSWSWESIWKGIAPVITTGAEAFSKIYPAITGKTATGQASMPVVRAGQVWPATQPVPTGFRRDPITGQLIPATAQAGITASPYFWPVVIGLGAMFLMTSGKQTRRR